MIARCYEYPATGQYNETVATLPDGRCVTINPQYGVVLPQTGHVPTCPQRTEMGGRCTCAANANIMAQAQALIAEAREHGRFGAAPRAAHVPSAEELAEERAIEDEDTWRSHRGLTLEDEMSRDDTIY